MEAPKSVTIAQELFTFEHTLTDVSMVYVGALLAGAVPLRTFLLITIAFISARGSGMLFNRYAGRALDVANKNKKKMQSLSLPRNLVLLAAIILSS